MENLNQYDISIPTEYLDRQMFLDERGVVTMQRFDQVRYPKIQTYEKIARGYIWTPEEIDLRKDRQDMKVADAAARHIVTANLQRQTTLDSLQGKLPALVFGPVCSVPELEALLSIWSTTETNIHSNAYSHIIRNIYSDSPEVFDKISEVKQIVQMAKNVGEHYETLHLLNCRRALGMHVDRMDHKRAIWMALHASYALEAIRFMVSFATTLGMMENRLFVGVGNEITLILQDELLHSEWTAWIINQVVKDDPDFALIKVEMAELVYDMYMGVIQEEKDWAKYLFMKGPVVGMNELIFCSFVDWQSREVLKPIGIKYICDTIPKTHPIPWYKKHSEIDKKQSALQETEATNYVIGMLSEEINLEELPDL